MKADRVRKWRKMEINTNTREMQVGRDVQSRETKEKARTSKRRQTNLGKSVIGCGGCRALCLERRKGKERKAKSKVNERNERETAIETGVVESFFLTFFFWWGEKVMWGRSWRALCPFTRSCWYRKFRCLQWNCTHRTTIIIFCYVIVNARISCHGFPMKIFRTGLRVVLTHSLTA